MKRGQESKIRGVLSSRRLSSLPCPLNHHPGLPTFLKQKSYCGYKNYETWNVATFIICNVEIYEQARFASDYPNYIKLMAWAGVYKTADDIDFDCDSLDVEQLNQVLEDL